VRRSHKRWRDQHSRKTQEEGVAEFLKRLPVDILKEEAIVVTVMKRHEGKLGNEKERPAREGQTLWINPIPIGGSRTAYTITSPIGGMGATQFTA
jgi:hypothetical protein